jgi:hypothetical protein
MLDEIGKRIAPGETLAVFPEGVTINFLARRVNPTPYVNFMPPELIIYGEDRILEAYRTHPPDYIVMVGRTTDEYGLRKFGQDFGRKLYAWIEQAYEGVTLAGGPPLESEKFGIGLARRKVPR